MFSNVPVDNVMAAVDASCIYELPLLLHAEGIDDKVCELLNIWSRAPDLAGWSRIPRHEDAPAGQKPGFEIHDGLLVSIPDAPEDDLWYTREKIGNATLRVVYKVSAPNANSGIFTRIPVEPKSEDDAINKGGNKAGSLSKTNKKPGDN